MNIPANTHSKDVHGPKDIVPVSAKYLFVKSRVYCGLFNFIYMVSVTYHILTAGGGVCLKLKGK